MMRQSFGQHQIGSAGGPATHRQIVHKSAHQKDAPARGAQQVFLSQRVGDLGKLKAAALVHNVDDHGLRLELDGQHNFLAAVLAISEVVGVDHAFAHGHAELIQDILGKASLFGDAYHDVFSEVHAFELGVQRDLETLV